MNHLIVPRSSRSASLRSRSFRRSHGQATVEMALLGIALVPLILYAFFLDDLLRYKLDESEAVFTSPWDFAVIDYENATSSIASETQHNIRLGYCDHTTAYSSYNATYDCTDAHHHVALTAHECWITKDAHQVTCTIPNQGVGRTDLMSTTFATNPVQNVNKGGLATCTAKLAVVNYFVPQRVLQWFTSSSNVSDNNGSGLGSGSDGTLMTSRASHGKGGAGNSEDIHKLVQNDIGETGSDDVYQLPEEGAGMVVDTWAMTTVKSVNPEDHSGTLYDRTKLSYTSGPSMAMLAESLVFIGQAISDKTLTPAALTDISGMSDGVLTPEVGFNAATGDPSLNGFYSSAWKDDGNNNTYNTHENEGDHYMGRTNIPTP